MSFNKVILMGRLTSDPELKQSTSGTSVVSINIAVDRRYNKGEDKQCDFITVVAWRQTAEFICKYFNKGQPILVCGELQTRSWTDQQGNKRYATEVVANEVSFCEAKGNNETNYTTAHQNAPQSVSAPRQATFAEVSPDDDLPF